MSTSTFAELGLSADILEAVERAGYISPTPVQQQTVPAMLQGGDVVIQSQTGTGKTAAFVLPIIEQLSARPGVIEALVLSPTRELAQQIANEVMRLGAGRSIISTAIYGGTSFQKQYDALETAQFVIATPGRLLDLMRRGRISLSKVRFFGLDEADELLSMGFEKDVTDVISKLPGKVQSFLCSATFSETIRRVADTFIADPTLINCSSDRIGAQSVRHVLLDTDSGARMSVLHRLIASEQIMGAVVFCNTKAATFRVFDSLQREGLRADILNGDLSQTEREKALERMRNGDVDFLVATDVAARGIDISGLPAVINFDMPETPEVYVHRTGRTGRAGQAGVAYSLLTPSDITVLHALEKFFRLKFVRMASPPRDLLMTLRADELLQRALDGLDEDASLEYAQWIPAARRLLATPDGLRTIAKLTAYFRQQQDGPSSAVAPPRPEVEPATVDDAMLLADDSTIGSPAPAAAPRPRAAARPVSAPAPADDVSPPTTDEENPVVAAFIADRDARGRRQFLGTRDLASRTRLTIDEVLRWIDRAGSLLNPGRRPDFFQLAGEDEEPAPVPAVVAASVPGAPDPAAPTKPVPSTAPAATTAPVASAPTTPAGVADADATHTPRPARKRPPRTKTAAAQPPAPAASAPAPPPAKPERAPASSRRRGAAPGRSRSPHQRVFDDPQVMEPPSHRDVVPEPAPAPPAKPRFGLLRFNIGPDQVADAETLALRIAEISGFDRVDDFGTVSFRGKTSVLEVRAEYVTDVQQAVHGERVGDTRLQVGILHRGGPR